jgi:hypothetical protein
LTTKLAVKRSNDALGPKTRWRVSQKCKIMMEGCQGQKVQDGDWGKQAVKRLNDALAPKKEMGTHRKCRTVTEEKNELLNG